MTVLYPTLAEIEARWFEPSDELLSRIAADDKDVPEELRNAVESNPDYAGFIEALRNPEPGDVDPPDRKTPIQESSRESVEPPDWMMELIEQKYTAQQKYEDTQPSPGCFVSVDRLVGPDGELPFDFNGPVAVMLDGLEATSDVWYGWITASETDYATDWDFVVQETDGVVDTSLVGIVQLWNPVRVYSKSIARVIGQLKPDSLSAIRALAAEFVTRGHERETPAIPGSIGLRTTLNDFIVVTGTPLAGREDPRWRYQEIYHQVADYVRKPARLAMAIRPRWEIWREEFISSIEGNPAFRLKPDPAADEFILGLPDDALLAAASGTDNELLEFKLQQDDQNDAVTMTITSRTSDSLRLEIEETAKKEIQTLSFNAAGESGQAKLFADGSYHFRLYDQHGRHSDIATIPAKPEG